MKHSPGWGAAKQRMADVAIQDGNDVGRLWPQLATLIPTTAMTVSTLCAMLHLVAATMVS